MHTAHVDTSGVLTTTGPVEIGDTITIFDPTPELVMTVEEFGTSATGYLHALGETQKGTLASVRLVPRAHTTR